jgi:tRNA pseudouridine65 synthase
MTKTEHPNHFQQTEGGAADVSGLDVIYRDQFIIAVHKPAGLLVHKSPIDKHETRYAMKILRDQIGQWVYPVHRLDKPTSGLLLFALHADIASQISQQFENRAIEKIYSALVRGFAPDSATIDHPLKEIAVFKQQQKYVELKDAKEAITHYTMLDQYELPYSDGRFATSRYSLLEVKPATGRKHQIRRHLKHISHPIIGDVKYGKGSHNRLFQTLFSTNRLMLAATDLSFEHPVSNETIHLNCPLEASFANTLERLSEFRFSL